MLQATHSGYNGIGWVDKDGNCIDEQGGCITGFYRICSKLLPVKLLHAIYLYHIYIARVK